MNDDQKSEPWYAVRCLFSHPTRANDADGNLYEERMTVWKCSSDEEAFVKATEEGKAYAKVADCIFIKATDSFHLFDKHIAESTEVWSTMRGSHMNPKHYESTYCTTPRDRYTPISIEHHASNGDDQISASEGDARSNNLDKKK